MSSREPDSPKLDLKGERVLFLNWRCPWHPLAGGAEWYCWNIATRFARAGAEVTLVTARPRGLAREEERAGVRIRRRGGALTVYFWAALYVLVHGGRFTTVIDCQNGIPFFAPVFMLWRQVSVLLVIHHVHQDQFKLHFGWPLATIGRFLEGPCSRWVYGKRPVIAVSPTTRAEVRRRLHLAGPIYIVPNGVEAPDFNSLPPRSAAPSIIYVGRLVRHKRVGLLLEAVAKVRERWPGLQVRIVGEGPEREHLERRAHQLGLDREVIFSGWVPDEERARMLAASWLLVTPSAGEGWGVTVIEANAVGRPALAFRVPGLVNSIVEGVNGWLMDEPRDLPSALNVRLRQLTYPDEAVLVADRCRPWASRFTWDRSAQRMAGLVAGAVPIVQPSRRVLPDGVSSDVATVVVLEDAGGLERLHPSLLPSDLWEIDGSTLRVLLQGQDQTTAIAALENLGLSGRATVRVASTSDLLLGLRERN
ncbi:MAG: glycosyltransferase family 4 protein [Chloroflexota bacterium]